MLTLLLSHADTSPPPPPPVRPLILFVARYLRFRDRRQVPTPCSRRASCSCSPQFSCSAFGAQGSAFRSYFVWNYQLGSVGKMERWVEISLTVNTDFISAKLQFRATKRIRPSWELWVGKVLLWDLWSTSLRPSLHPFEFLQYVFLPLRLVSRSQNFGLPVFTCHPPLMGTAIKCPVESRCVHIEIELFAATAEGLGGRRRRCCRVDTTSGRREASAKRERTHAFTHARATRSIRCDSSVSRTTRARIADRAQGADLQELISLLRGPSSDRASRRHRRRHKPRGGRLCNRTDAILQGRPFGPAACRRSR